METICGSCIVISRVMCMWNVLNPKDNRFFIMCGEGHG